MVLLAFCIACLIIALFARDAAQVVALAIGCLSFIAGIVIIVYAVAFRPELLRSERHQQTMRLIEMVGDKEMTQTDLNTLIPTLLGPARWRKRGNAEKDHD